MKIEQLPAAERVATETALEDEGALDGLLAEIEPEDDVEVSAAHRRRVAPVLARRALRAAVASARQREKT
jgi:CO/xanthine dehydrogenase FAD-binding subunit